jgi:quercetin dioxygenase-like cupin family protein
MECRPGWILDEHDHPSDVVTYCLRGEGQLRIEQRTASYLAGELVAIPARTPHWFQSGEAGALLIIFVFEPSII